MNASDALESLIGNHLLRDGTWTKPAALYAALYTTLPNDDNSGVEVSGGSYARVACGPGNTQWAETAVGTFKNAMAVLFPAPTASWGTVVGWGLLSASTGGTLLVWGALTEARLVQSGDLAPQFAAGKLIITVD